MCLEPGTLSLYLVSSVFLTFWSTGIHLHGTQFLKYNFLVIYLKCYKQIIKYLGKCLTENSVCSKRDTSHSGLIGCRPWCHASPSPELLRFHQSLLTGSSAASSPSLSHKHVWAICVLKTGRTYRLPLPHSPVDILQ